MSPGRRQGWSTLRSRPCLRTLAGIYTMFSFLFLIQEAKAYVRMLRTVHAVAQTNRKRSFRRWPCRAVYRGIRHWSSRCVSLRIVFAFVVVVVLSVAAVFVDSVVVLVTELREVVASSLQVLHEFPCQRCSLCQ